MDHPALLLQPVFTSLCTTFRPDARLVNTLWGELESCYTQRGRHYHNLNHLAHLYQQLCLVQTAIQRWDILLFSLFYHDIIYSVHKRDNEEKSADYAAEQLARLGISVTDVALCHAQILATKTHTPSPNPDTNYFTDADLAILGASREAYAVYTRQIRKEYRMYPDLLYKPGRKKVLLHFLQMDRLYKTAFFYERLEAAARANLAWELDQLS
jgi:predicted metal-dependent HD superfamily phosphohydrolase